MTDDDPSDDERADGDADGETDAPGDRRDGDDSERVEASGNQPARRSASESKRGDTRPSTGARTSRRRFPVEGLLWSTIALLAVWFLVRACIEVF